MEKELLCILKKYETHPDFLGDTIKDINQVGGMDDTVLHIAARNNSLNDALVFLQNGALINLKGDLGYTPLHYACMFGNIEMVKLSSIFLLVKIKVQSKIENSTMVK